MSLSSVAICSPNKGWTCKTEKNLKTSTRCFVKKKKKKDRAHSCLQMRGICLSTIFIRTDWKNMRGFSKRACAGREVKSSKVWPSGSLHHGPVVRQQASTKTDPLCLTAACFWSCCLHLLISIRQSGMLCIKSNHLY